MGQSRVETILENIIGSSTNFEVPKSRIEELLLQVSEIVNSNGSIILVSDEGKVVSNGSLVAQSSQSITENGTYDTTLINEVVVEIATTTIQSASGISF